MRRRWFPKITVTVLEPVKLSVDPALKGRKRRQAAGAALYEIMSDLIFDDLDRSYRSRGRDRGGARSRHGLDAVEDPVSGPLSYAAW